MGEASLQCARALTISNDEMHYDDISAFFQGFMEQLSLSVDAIADVTEEAAVLAGQTVVAEQKLFVCGVGPDAPAAGLLCELLQQGIYRERPAIPAVELTARHMTHLDPGIGWVSQQLTALGQAGDMAVFFVSSANQVDMEFLAAAVAKRSMHALWIGTQGAGPSLPFAGADRASALALSQCTALCLARLIDSTLFGPLEEN